ALIYQLLLVAQVAFYGVSLLGWFLESRRIKIKIFFIPYYFCMMNYAVIRGIARFSTGKQSAIWEKAKRK
ncbi:MAG: glycosyltransferase family 2 protein, partial [Mucilaginibacter sp.]